MLLPVLEAWPSLNSSFLEISDSQQQPPQLREIQAHKVRKVCKDRMEILEVTDFKGFKVIRDLQDVPVQALRFQAPLATRERLEPQDQSGLLE